jgi:uncharacterized membrane protein
LNRRAVSRSPFCCSPAGACCSPGGLNYLEAFVIHAWCEWCLGSATLVLILFVLALLDWRDTGSGYESELRA